MKKTTKSILGILAGAIFLFAATAFIISDPEADFIKKEWNLTNKVSLSEIVTENSTIGHFKSSVKFKQNNRDASTKEFYGLELMVANNPKIDRILIGVTNNLISRVEIWNQRELIETKELGFMDKMTRGEVQTMSVDFYDQTNSRYKGKSKILMRFYSGTGFFGDIGTVHFNLTPYGDLSAAKELKLFSKSLESKPVHNPEFSDLKIWKNYKSFD